MLRTLIVGAALGYIGKKFYDDGTLSQLGQDIGRRFSSQGDDDGKARLGEVSKGAVNGGHASAAPAASAV